MQAGADWVVVDDLNLNLDGCTTEFDIVPFSTNRHGLSLNGCPQAGGELVLQVEHSRELWEERAVESRLRDTVALMAQGAEERTFRPFSSPLRPVEVRFDRADWRAP
jgi:hypothetical protein